MAKTFILDVLPLFRTGDISCMTRFGVMLGDADWMCDPGPANGFDDHGNARGVHSTLARGSMPPDGAGPQSRLQTYEQWMRDGFLR
jgi:hypothetical protein